MDMLMARRIEDALRKMTGEQRRDLWLAVTDRSKSIDDDLDISEQLSILRQYGVEYYELQRYVGIHPSPPDWL